MMSSLDMLSLSEHIQQSGVLTLRQAGLLKASAGVTSHEEVWAATSV
jgi:type II secretory ATPase GspE/PulE/Tfp pilus assembly ATPase PilB-like protein